MRVYLDNCCFNRPFDDQRQTRVRLETEAKPCIQEQIRSGTLELVWSYDCVEHWTNRIVLCASQGEPFDMVHDLSRRQVERSSRAA